MAREEAAMVMADLVRTIVESIVDRPETVAVKADLQNVEHVTLRVTALPTDIGRLIGKHGAMARSIRTILNAGSKTSGIQCRLDICEAE